MAVLFVVRAAGRRALEALKRQTQRTTPEQLGVERDGVEHHVLGITAAAGVVGWWDAVCSVLDQIPI